LRSSHRCDRSCTPGDRYRDRRCGRARRRQRGPSPQPSSKTTGADYLLLGCWTSGAIVVLQHPERIWVAFARRLPDLAGTKIGLFATYTIATGSMFRGMRRRPSCDPADIQLELKSRDGELSESHRASLDRFLRD